MSGSLSRTTDKSKFNSVVSLPLPVPVPLPSTTKFNFGEWQPQTYDGQVEVQLGERRVELGLLVSALAGDYYDSKNVVRAPCC